MEGTAGVELSKGGGQDPVQGLPSTNPENVQSLNTDTKNQGRLASSGPSLNNPSFLWQDLAAAKPPMTQSRVMPGQALVSGNKTFRPQDVSPLVVSPLVVSPLFSTLVVSPPIP